MESNNELTKILGQLSLDDLMYGVGGDICGIVEYIKSEVSAQSIIKVAIQGFGKTLLERKELRLTLLLTLKRDEILNLAKSLKFNLNNYEDIIYKISNIPFRTDKNTLKILQALGLNESYLPDVNEKDNRNNFEIPCQNYFYEQLDYQFDIRVKVLKYFREIDMARCIVHMPTGSGKTKTAMHIVNEYWSIDNKGEGLILWLAHSEELLLQALNAFENIWSVLGKFSTNVIKFWGHYDLPTELPKCGIVFIGIQKLISFLKKTSDKLTSLKHNTRMIILDEAHKAPAKETLKALLELLKYKQGDPNKVLLGLTATPGRSGACEIQNRELLTLFDGVKIGIDLDLMKMYSIGDKDCSSEIELLQDKKILSKFKRFTIPFDPRELNLNHKDVVRINNSISHESAKIPSDILEKISKNKMRNNIILDRIINYFHDGNRILVFACNVSHAYLLASALNLKKIKCGLILGTTDTITRNKIISEFRNNASDLKILINVDVLTTGFDAPNIDCVFIARPVVSVILYSQMIGRGIRGPMMGGTEECKLIEVIDEFEFGNEAWAFNYFDNYWN